MRTSIIHLTTVEMHRALHRRLVRFMVLLAVALSALAGIIVFVTSRDPVALAREHTHPAHMASWWAGGGEDSLLLTAAIFLVVGAAICGASVAGAEWKAGTMTTVLTWEPSRLRLHAARTVSAAILAFVIGFALQAVFLFAAVPAVVLNGDTEGTTGAWWVGLLVTMGRMALITSLVAVLAVSTASIGRNTSAGLIAIAAWVLVVERTVTGLRPRLGRFMVGENLATVIPWSPLTDVEFERPPIIALVTLLAYLAVLTAVATGLFVRRDVVTV
jgi:hypothetical protein